jgi:hypothetical protein
MILLTAVRLSNKPPVKSDDTSSRARTNPEKWTFADRERIQIELFRRDIEMVHLKTCSHRRLRVAEEI